MNGKQRNYKTVNHGELIQWASQSSDLKEALKWSWYWYEQLRQPEAKGIWVNEGLKTSQCAASLA